MRLVIAIVVAALAAGCPHPPPAAPAERGPVVEAHSDSATVSVLATAGPVLLVGTSGGLDRWDLRPSPPVRLPSDPGLVGTSVRGLVVEPGNQAAWAATASGVAHLDVASGKIDRMSAPPAALAPTGSKLSAVALDENGGLWVGGSSGLLHLDASGGWLGAGWTRPVNALWAQGGQVYIGGDGGLVVRHVDGSFHEVGADAGCTLVKVRFFVAAPDGSPVVVGDGKDGETLVALRIGQRFTTFKPSPAVRFVAGTRQLDTLIMASAERLWVLSAPRSGARALRRDGARLVPVAGGSRSPYQVRPSDASLPPGVTALAASGDAMFVGTRWVGVARYQAPSPRPSWLRRGDLADGAQRLTVACTTAKDCWVATGGHALWHYDGQGFSASLPEPGATRVLAAVRSPTGATHVLYLTQTDDKLHVARLEGTAWKPTVAIAVTLPGPLAGLSFANYSPDGLLWVGILYTDSDGEPRRFGVATLELDLALVTYHRQERGNQPRKTGILPIPNDVNDVAFDPGDATERLDVWFATSSGAAHMSLPDDKVELFTEAEGLDSEILHAVAISTGGMVYVASTRGVGTYDGETWAFPRALAVAASALTVSADGRLWIGTDRGVMVFDGARGQRVEARAGLLSEAIGDLELDGQGRVWTLSEQGIGIIHP